MKLELRRVTVKAPGAANARQSWPERSSLLLRLSDARANAGIGEASPLPGYSRDTLSDTEAWLAQLEPSVIQRALELETAAAVLGSLSQLVPPTLPAARFGLETAALDLLGRMHRVPAPELLGAAHGATRAVSALIGKAIDADLFERAALAVASGYACLKLKLGVRGELERELSRVRELRRRLGPQVALRLDANGSLSPAELERAAVVLGSASIELFEEPGSHAVAGVALAVDESLQGLDEVAAEAHVRGVNAAFLVLKPTALGGLTHCRRLAERASALGASVVVSHGFDGPWAFRAAAALALALPPGPAHGLAPHAALASWPASARDCVQDGALQSWTEPGLGVEGGFE